MLPITEFRHDRDFKSLMELRKTINYNMCYYRPSEWSNKKQEQVYKNPIEYDRKKRDKIVGEGIKLFKKGIIELAEKYKREE